MSNAKSQLKIENISGSEYQIASSPSDNCSIASDDNWRENRNEEQGLLGSRNLRIPQVVRRLDTSSEASLENVGESDPVSSERQRRSKPLSARTRGIDIPTWSQDNVTNLQNNFTWINDNGVNDQTGLRKSLLRETFQGDSEGHRGDDGCENLRRENKRLRRDLTRIGNTLKYIQKTLISDETLGEFDGKTGLSDGSEAILNEESLLDLRFLLDLCPMFDNGLREKVSSWLRGIKVNERENDPGAEEIAESLCSLLKETLITILTDLSTIKRSLEREFKRNQGHQEDNLLWQEKYHQLEAMHQICLQENGNLAEKLSRFSSTIWETLRTISNSSGDDEIDLTEDFLSEQIVALIHEHDSNIIELNALKKHRQEEEDSIYALIQALSEAEMELELCGRRPVNLKSVISNFIKNTCNIRSTSMYSATLGRLILQVYSNQLKWVEAYEEILKRFNWKPGLGLQVNSLSTSEGKVDRAISPKSDDTLVPDEQSDSPEPCDSLNNPDLLQHSATSSLNRIFHSLDLNESDVDKVNFILMNATVDQFIHNSYRRNLEIVEEAEEESLASKSLTVNNVTDGNDDDDDEDDDDDCCEEAMLNDGDGKEEKLINGESDEMIDRQVKHLLEDIVQKVCQQEEEDILRANDNADDTSTSTSDPPSATEEDASEKLLSMVEETSKEDLIDEDDQQFEGGSNGQESLHSGTEEDMSMTVSFNMEESNQADGLRNQIIVTIPLATVDDESDDETETETETQLTSEEKSSQEVLIAGPPEIIRTKPQANGESHSKLKQSNAGQRSVSCYDLAGSQQRIDQAYRDEISALTELVEQQKTILVRLSDQLEETQRNFEQSETELEGLRIFKKHFSEKMNFRKDVAVQTFDLCQCSASIESTFTPSMDTQSTDLNRQRRDSSSDDENNLDCPRQKGLFQESTRDHNFDSLSKQTNDDDDGNDNQCDGSYSQDNPGQSYCDDDDDYISKGTRSSYLRGSSSSCNNLNLSTFDSEAGSSGSLLPLIYSDGSKNKELKDYNKRIRSGSCDGHMYSNNSAFVGRKSLRMKTVEVVYLPQALRRSNQLFFNKEGDKNLLPMLVPRNYSTLKGSH